MDLLMFIYPKIPSRSKLRYMTYNQHYVKSCDVCCWKRVTYHDDIDGKSGKNPIVNMTWEEYNFEDAVIMSEHLVKEDVYTSVHLEEFESETRDTKLGPEEITREIQTLGRMLFVTLDKQVLSYWCGS